MMKTSHSPQVGKTFLDLMVDARKWLLYSHPGECCLLDERQENYFFIVVGFSWSMILPSVNITLLNAL